jgi:fibronectin-binding autotransporter adhesin
MIRNPLIAGVCALAVIAASATVAQGQTTYTWNGGGGNGNWSVAANWGGTGPVSDLNNTLIVLQGTTQPTTVLDLAPGSTFSVNTLTLNSGASAFAVNAAATPTTLQIGSGGIAQGATNSLTIATPVAVGASQTWATNNTGALTVSGAVNLGSGNTLTLGGSSSGGITISGAVTLGGNNTISVATTGSGTPTISGAVNLGANTLTLDDPSTRSLTLSGIVSGTGGGITKTSAGSGVVTLSGANTYTGITTVSSGILATTTLANGGAASGIGQSSNAATNLVLDGGTFRYTGAAVSTDRLFTVTANGGTLQANGSGAVTFANTGAIVFSGGTPSTFTLDGTSTAANTLAAVIGDGAGATSLVKNGAGTWALTATNTYTGTTTINTGTLQFNSPAAIPGSGATLTVNNAGAAAAGYAIDQAFLGRIINTSTGAAALGVDSSNNLDFNAAGFTALRLGATGGATVNYTGTLTPNGTAYRFGGPAGGTLTLPNVLPDVGGPTNVEVGLNGLGGTIALNGANTYTGTTTIGGGVLAVATLPNGGIASGIGQSSNAAGNLILSGGTLRYTGGAATSTDRLFTLGTGTSGVDSSGAGVLTFANTGAIAFSGSGTRTFTLTGSTGPVTTTAGTGYTIPLSVAFNTFNPVITDGTGGATSLSKTGAGTWVIQAPNTFTGNTTVSAGTLAVNRVTAGTTPVGTGTINLSGGTLSFRATSSPVTVTGFTQDVISSFNDIASPNPFGTTTSIDAALGANAGFVLFENRPDFLSAYTLPTTIGLPTGGRFVHLNNPVTTFQMAAYDGGSGGTINNNSLYLSNAAGTTGRLTLGTPGQFQTLNVLATSGNGASSYTAVLHFTDGSTTTVTGLSSPDWFNGASPALQIGGRMTRVDGTPNNNSPNPQLYSQEIFLSSADQAKTLNWIDFTYANAGTSGSSLNIFGVSGVAPGGPNSYANNVNVTASSTLQMLNTGSLSFGTLSINGSTLTTSTGTVSGTSLTFTGTTLSGNPTFNIATGQTFTPGAINFGSAARTITLSGGGIVVFDTAATNATATNTLTVNAGTASVTNGTSLGTAPNLTVGGGVANMGPYTALTTLTVNGGTANLPNVVTVTTATSGGGTTNFGTGVAVGGTLTVNGGTVNLGGATSAARLTGTGGTIALGANTLTFGSGNANDSYAGTITGAGGSLTKVGTGTETLSGPASTFSGGTNLTAGRITATRPGTLGTGTVTLSTGTTLGIGGLVGATISGFNGTGSGWNLQGGATVSGDVLTLTTNVNNQTRSAWFTTKEPTNSFTASFDYIRGPNGSGNPADGATFTIQNQSATALGGGGGSLGYNGITTPNAGLLLNIYNPNGRGIAFRTNGTTGTYTAVAPVDIFNSNGAAGTNTGPVTFNLTYDGTAHTLAIVLTQGTNSFTLPTQTLDLSTVGAAGAGGGTVWVGFTGATGGENSDQRIANFSFNLTGTSPPPISTYTNAVTIPDAAAVTITPKLTTGVTTFAMGNLSMGSGAALTVTPDTGSLADTAFNLTLGATTLNGAATFTVANNGAGAGQLTLGALNDGGTARTITKSGAGILNLSAAATSLVNGTQVNVTAGTLRVTNATALGTLAGVDLAASTSFSLGANQTVAALTGTGGAALNGNTLTIGSTNNLDSTFGGVIADGTAAGGLTKAGTGTFTLTGANTYTGTTTISAGTLQIGNGGTSGSITANVTDNAALVFNRSDTSTYAGVISGTGTVTQAGTGTTILTGNSTTFSGVTTIAAGTLQLGNGGTSGSIAGNVTNSAALVFNRSNTFTIGGVISGSGTVTQAGTGTTILTGANTYSGGTAVNAGTLLANGQTGTDSGTGPGAVAVNSGGTLGGTGRVGGAVNVNSGGRLAGGSGGTGTLAVAGNTVFNTSGKFAVAAAASGTNNVLAVQGVSTTVDFKAGSILDLSLLSGFSNTSPASYTVLTMPTGGGNNILNDGSPTSDGDVLGRFFQGTGASGTVTIQPSGFALNTGDQFWLIRSGDSMVLGFAPVPEPGMVLAISAAALGLWVWTRRWLRHVRAARGVPALG